jgi:hypothetical protein
MGVREWARPWRSLRLREMSELDNSQSQALMLKTCLFASNSACLIFRGLGLLPLAELCSAQFPPLPYDSMLSFSLLLLLGSGPFCSSLCFVLLIR